MVRASLNVSARITKSSIYYYDEDGVISADEVEIEFSSVSVIGNIHGYKPCQ